MSAEQGPQPFGVGRMPVPQARPGSLEALLHEATGAQDALVVFPTDPAAGRKQWWHSVLDHRAIGVVYHPESEHWRNYVPSVWGRRYDAFIYCDHTTARQPLRPVE